MLNSLMHVHSKENIWFCKAGAVQNLLHPHNKFMYYAEGASDERKRRFYAHPSDGCQPAYIRGASLKSFYFARVTKCTFGTPNKIHKKFGLNRNWYLLVP